jgi:hypothetical protein
MTYTQLGARRRRSSARQPGGWVGSDLQPEPLLAVDEARAEERPRLVVGERAGPRHPVPRARPWALAAVLPEQHRPVQKKKNEPGNVTL